LAVSPLNGEIQFIYSERLQGLDVAAFTGILEIPCWPPPTYRYSPTR
jgi:hypothetical protein